MEDRVHIHCQRFPSELLDYIYLAVFDGHGGAEASEFAKQYLLNAILEQKGFQQGCDQGILEAIREGFLQTQRCMEQVVDKWPTTSLGSTSTSGTTATVVFIRNEKLYFGHVGDSGIVLGIREPNTDEHIVGKKLTADHKPDNPAEFRRIQNSGGQVMNNRVVWTRSVRGQAWQKPFLAVARSLGDLWSYNDQLNKYVVSPDPDVEVVALSSKQKCMVLGSDGLWDVITSQHSVDIVNAHEWKEVKDSVGLMENDLKFLDRASHCNHSCWLLQHAHQGWGAWKADNISVITVIFDLPDAQLDDKSLCVVQADPHLDIEKALSDTPDAMIRITPFSTQVLKTSPLELTGTPAAPHGCTASNADSVSKDSMSFDGSVHACSSSYSGFVDDVDSNVVENEKKHENLISEQKSPEKEKVEENARKRKIHGAERDQLTWKRLCLNQASKGSVHMHTKGQGAQPPR